MGNSCPSRGSSWERWLVGRDRWGVTGGPFMDAMYPRVLTEAGLFGLFTFGFLMVAIWRTTARARDRLPDPYTRGLALGFLLGFVGLLVHAVGSNTFIIVRIMEPFWLVCGLMVKSVILAEGKQAESADPPPDPPFMSYHQLPGSTLGYRAGRSS